MCKGCSTLFHMLLVDIDVTQKSHCKPHRNGRGISKFSLGWMWYIFLSAFFSLPSSLVFLVWPRLSYSLECNVWTSFQSSHNHQSKTIYWVQLEPLKRNPLKGAVSWILTVGTTTILSETKKKRIKTLIKEGRYCIGGKPVSVKRRLRTADRRPGVKCQTECKMQTEHKLYSWNGTGLNQNIPQKM